MGCDIHTVLQKKVDGKWVTVDKDIMPGRDYFLFGDLAGVRCIDGLEIGMKGLPNDFEVEGREEMRGPFGETEDELMAADRDTSCMFKQWIDGPKHEGYWMGDHSHGYINLQDLIDYPTPESPNGLDRYTIEKDSDSITLRLMDEEYEHDEHRGLRELQMAFRTLYGGDSGTFEWEGKTTEYGPKMYRLVYGFDS